MTTSPIDDETFEEVEIIRFYKPAHISLQSRCRLPAGYRIQRHGRPASQHQH